MLNNFINKYEYNHYSMIRSIIFSLIFTGISFLFFNCYSIINGKPINIAMLLTGFFLIIIGAFFLKQNLINNYSIHLYENGIIVFSNYSSKEYSYKEIEEYILYIDRFKKIHMAIRNKNEKKWIKIVPHIKNPLSFIKQFRTFYPDIRLPYLLEKIAKGHQIEFNYVTKNNNFFKKYFSPILKKFDGKIILDQTKFTVNGKDYYYINISDIKIEEYYYLSIYNNYNQCIIKYPLYNISNPDVIYSLINNLIRNERKLLLINKLDLHLPKLIANNYK